MRAKWPAQRLTFLGILSIPIRLMEQEMIAIDSMKPARSHVCPVQKLWGKIMIRLNDNCSRPARKATALCDSRTAPQRAPTAHSADPRPARHQLGIFPSRTHLQPFAPIALVSAKSDGPRWLGSCPWGKITSRSGSTSARHVRTRRSGVRRWREGRFIAPPPTRRSPR
jgi:hypothetical protein